MIHHIDHVMKHLPITGTTVLRYESGYAAHHITKTFAGLTLCRCIMPRLYLLEVQNFVVREETGQATAILVQRPENKIYTGPFSCTAIITVPADIPCP